MLYILSIYDARFRYMFCISFSLICCCLSTYSVWVVYLLHPFLHHYLCSRIYQIYLSNFFLAEINWKRMLQFENFCLWWVAFWIVLVQDKVSFVYYLEGCGGNNFFWRTDWKTLFRFWGLVLGRILMVSSGVKFDVLNI